jgi:hypothetical protein
MIWAAVKPPAGTMVQVRPPVASGVEVSMSNRIGPPGPWMCWAMIGPLRFE